ncbi:MAG: polysaccharide deacetylase family protein [Bacteroidetes bacterium]|nr:polysaccharide deacetylase family protein [Bacteroidota bacterium]
MKKGLLKFSGLFSRYISLDKLKKISGQYLISPVYHLSCDYCPPHIKHIYPVRDTNTFKADLDFFLTHYYPLSLEDVSQLTKSTNQLSQPSFYLSFDDGLREIYDVVAPILKEKGIPATFFINSAFVDNKQLFYRYKASLLVEQLQTNNWSVAVTKQITELLARKGIMGNPSKGLMMVSYQDQEVLDQIAVVVNYDFDQFLHQYQPYLTREQIQSLLDDGFTIGAHSVDHPEYRFISLEEQLCQTRESIDWLQKQFSMPFRSFAFPFTDFGVKKLFFDRISEEDMLDISFGCAGLKTDIYPWHLQRLPMEGDLRDAETIVKTEYLYFWVKEVFGKNKIHRVW